MASRLSQAASKLQHIAPLSRINELKKTVSGKSKEFNLEFWHKTEEQ